MPRWPLARFHSVVFSSHRRPTGIHRAPPRESQRLSGVSCSTRNPIPFLPMATLFDMEPATPEEPALKVNDAQKRAITHGEGPLLVIAGAGTGKTRVITERIRHLLQTDPKLSGENILALTFTKKAAGEMKARVMKAAGERGRDVTLATFHSFCETLLKEVEPNRAALEQVDHWILLRRNMGRLRLEKHLRLGGQAEI